MSDDLLQQEWDLWGQPPAEEDSPNCPHCAALRALLGELAAAANAVGKLWSDCVLTAYPGPDRERASAAMSNLRALLARAEAAARGEEVQGDQRGADASDASGDRA
jgi:hypothetical protein